MNKFFNINYLRSGTQRQQEAFKELTELGIFKKLKQYKPLLAGTIPIEIDLLNSDLDIICTCQDHISFTDKLIKKFGEHPNFKIKTKLIESITTTIATFDGNIFPIEIFGQNIDSVKQNAFQHMLIEHQILEQKGKKFKEKVITLKQNGLTTEQAFAHLLGLVGNPYKELLKYNN